MSDIRPGTKVHVEFDGTVAVDCSEYIKQGMAYDPDDNDDCGFIVVEDAQSIEHVIWVNGDGEPEVFEILEDPNWPPRAGDIWQALEREYVAQPNMFGGIILREIDGGYIIHPLSIFKTLSPKLIRRR